MLPEARLAIFRENYLRFLGGAPQPRRDGASPIRRPDGYSAFFSGSLARFFRAFRRPTALAFAALHFAFVVAMVNLLSILPGH
jgi:hypothetical protein